MLLDFGYSWLNLASLLCGLGAWAAPLAALAARRRPAVAARWQMLSLLLCALAFYCQLGYAAHLAGIGDVSAFLDTQTAVFYTATVLLVSTLLLNAGALLVRMRCKTGSV